MEGISEKIVPPRWDAADKVFSRCDQWEATADHIASAHCLFHVLAMTTNAPVLDARIKEWRDAVQRVMQ